eukprot:104780-Pelagomonas_calceolata.AAC.1
MWSISSQRGHLPELEKLIVKACLCVYSSNHWILPGGVADLLVSKLRDGVVCFSVCSGGGWYGIIKFLPSVVVVARDVSRAKLVFLVHKCFVVQVFEVVD